MAKKTGPKKAALKPTKRAPAAAAATATTPAPPVTSPTETPKPKAAAPRRASARLHRSQLTAAGLRGRDLVRYLLIHSKRPYGDRGVRALVELAREVGHLGRVELNQVAPVEEPTGN